MSTLVSLSENATNFTQGKNKLEEMKSTQK